MEVILTIVIGIPVLAMLAGLIMRIAPRHLAEVRFQDTDRKHAAAVAQSYAEGTYENRLGYPTGFYDIDHEASSLPDKIVVKEAQPHGTVTDGCAVGVLAAGSEGFDAGFGAGCISMMIAGIVAAPFYIVSSLDRMYRSALRSKVVVRLRSDGNDTIAKVSLHGAGAFLMKSRYEKVFDAPQLPERFLPPVESSPTEAHVEAA